MFTLKYFHGQTYPYLVSEYIVRYVLLVAKVYESNIFHTLFAISSSRAEFSSFASNIREIFFWYITRVGKDLVKQKT